MKKTLRRIRKNIVYPIAILVATGAITFGAISANAYFEGKYHNEVIKDLSQKLGVEETKVKSALDSIRLENQKLMLQKIEENLNQAVKDGKITEAQKNLIVQKKAELQKK